MIVSVTCKSNFPSSSDVRLAGRLVTPCSRTCCLIESCHVSHRYDGYWFVWLILVHPLHSNIYISNVTMRRSEPQIIMHGDSPIAAVMHDGYMVHSPFGDIPRKRRNKRGEKGQKKSREKKGRKETKPHRTSPPIFTPSLLLPPQRKPGRHLLSNERCRLSFLSLATLSMKSQTLVISPFNSQEPHLANN